MLESVREIHGHTGGQQQSEKSTKNRDGFYRENYLHNSSKVSELAKLDRQLCHATKLCKKVAQLCCVSDMGLSDDVVNVDVQNLSVNIQPHQIDIDELNALMKNGQMRDGSASAQLADVNQRWTIILQHIIDTKVRCLPYHTLLVIHCFDLTNDYRGSSPAGHRRSRSNRLPVALCTLGLGLLNPPSFRGQQMSTGYGWEGIRQVCATLLGAHHVPECLCGGLCLQRGAITSVRPLPFTFINCSPTLASPATVS